jgi:hypothetical protein
MCVDSELGDWPFTGAMIFFSSFRFVYYLYLDIAMLLRSDISDIFLMLIYSIYKKKTI